jgi:transcriptional regulator with XRE-family HTH domain
LKVGEKMRLGDMIRDYRRERGMTQETLAAQVGIGGPALSDIERGCRPSVENAKRLGRIVGFDWTRFYEGVGEAYEDGEQNK